MTAYLVRMKRSHNIIYIGCAQTLANLYLAIDEVAVPTDCEFVTLPETGGILWSGRSPKDGCHIDIPKVPMRRRGFLDFSEAVLSGAWRPFTHRGGPAIEWQNGAEVWAVHKRGMMFDIARLQREIRPIEACHTPVPQEFWAAPRVVG